MSANAFGTVLLWLIGLAAVIVILVYIMRWLYRRSTKETAFVRTGFLGEKVVVNSGAFVIPVLHEITPVNMNVLRIEVARRDNGALITRDRMRVDLIAEFFVRVAASKVAVAAAAQTLGRRTLQEDGIRGLLEGKFASSMRMVAAQMTLEEMHEQRRAYANQVPRPGFGGARHQRPGVGGRGDRRPRSDRASNTSIPRMLLMPKASLNSRIDRKPPPHAQRDRAARARRYPQPESRWHRRRSLRSIGRPNMRGSNRNARSRSAALCNVPNSPKNARCGNRKPSRLNSLRARLWSGHALRTTEPSPRSASKARKTRSGAKSPAAALSTKRS